MTAIDHVTVISLDRTPARFATFLDNNGGLPIERFAATDGQLLDRWDCVDNGLITPGNPYSLGTLGAAISHITLWQRAAAENRPFHIAEDDAIFRRDFITRASAMLAALGDWDFVLWAWNFDWPMEVELGPGLGSAVLECNEKVLVERWNAFPSSTIETRPMRLVSNSGCCAYSISPKGARRILERALPISGAPARYPGKPDIAWANRTIDVEIARHYEALEAFVSVPGLAISLNEKASSTT